LHIHTEGWLVGRTDKPDKLQGINPCVNGCMRHKKQKNNLNPNPNPGSHLEPQYRPSKLFHIEETLPQVRYAVLSSKLANKTNGQKRATNA
jgi:hypothetical protein